MCCGQKKLEEEQQIVQSDGKVVYNIKELDGEVIWTGPIAKMGGMRGKKWQRRVAQFTVRKSVCCLEYMKQGVRG